MPHILKVEILGSDLFSPLTIFVKTEILIFKQKKELGTSLIKQDGGPESEWILLDVGGVVIHLFNKETREYYDLESLWSSAKTILHIH